MFQVPINAGPAVGALRVVQQQGRYYYADGTEAVPFDPIDDFAAEDNLRSWGDAALSEHAQLCHLRTQERFHKDTYLRHCAMQLGSESLFDQANLVLAGLSGALPDELEQEIMVSGLSGELCRIKRPARALTVRGDSRKQDDLPWIIIRIEEETSIPREQIRLLHQGRELTAPAWQRGNTDLRLAGRFVDLMLIHRPEDTVEFQNYYWRLQDLDRKHILEKKLETILSLREHRFLKEEPNGLDPWGGMTKINPDQYLWSAKSRNAFTQPLPAATPSSRETAGSPALN